ncbi:MAG: hypothetical protein RLZZ292_1227 [Bacteroidota bacterium]|jgi:REP element-mobilizing transposase RayT
MNPIYRSRLPHIHPIGATFFVTFNLKGAMPQAIVNMLNAQKEANVKIIKAEKDEKMQQQLIREHKLHFKHFEQYLDNAPAESPMWLREQKIVDIVKQGFEKQVEKQLYDMIAYCIMPNHVHALMDFSVQVRNANEEDFFLTQYVQLEKVLKDLKGSTARYANLALERSGSFWHKDSYNHYVRNDAEYYNIIRYILQNPVKAKLVEKWEAWSNTYLNPLVPSNLFDV